MRNAGRELLLAYLYERIEGLERPQEEQRLFVDYESDVNALLEGTQNSTLLTVAQTGSPNDSTVDALRLTHGWINGEILKILSILSKKPAGRPTTGQAEFREPQPGRKAGTSSSSR